MKRLILVLLTFSFLSFTASAYTVPDSTIVYITPSGEKYHREDCSYTSAVNSLTLKEAEQQGYDPCSRCDPDVFTGEYKSDWDGSSNSFGSSSRSLTESSANEAFTQSGPSVDSPSSGSDTKERSRLLEILEYVFIKLMLPYGGFIILGSLLVSSGKRK